MTAPSRRHTNSVLRRSNALLKPSVWNTPDDHQVVCQDSKSGLAFLAIGLSGAEGGAEDTFGLGESAFDMPSLTIDATKETRVHLSSILGSGFGGVAAARVKGNDGGANAKLFATQAVVMFAVVRGIGQQAIKGNVLGDLSHRFGRLGRVVTRPPGDADPGKKVGIGMAHHGQFRPAASKKLSISFAVHIIRTGVTGLEARRIHRALGVLINQAQCVGPLKKGRQPRVESPFFSRRFSA